MSYGYRQYRDTAHRWTQIGAGLISVIAGLILIVCVTAPMYVSSMLKDAGLSAAISHRFMDTVFDSLGDNMEALSRIQTSIEDSKIVDRIAQKYTTGIIIYSLICSIFTIAKSCPDYCFLYISHIDIRCYFFICHIHKLIQLCIYINLYIAPFYGYCF